MRQFLFLLGVFGCADCMAQSATSSNPITLAKGQVITVTTTSNSDAQMGIPMKMNMSGTSIISVIDVNDKDYKLSNTTSKLTLSINAMGQESTYDSDKEADKDSEIGREVSKSI